MARALLVLAASLLLGATPAVAEGEWSRDVARDIMSPYCPGRTLSDCPSPQAAELRSWIAAQEEAGRTREAVEEQLYRVYGDEIRSAPRPRGWGLTAYLLPLGGLLAGGVLLAVFLRRQGGGEAPPPDPPPGPVDADLERVVDEELEGAAR